MLSPISATPPGWGETSPAMTREFQDWNLALLALTVRVQHRGEEARNIVAPLAPTRRRWTLALSRLWKSQNFVTRKPSPSTVASPLELQFGEIPGLTQMTSSSALGYVQITLQFELSPPNRWRRPVTRCRRSRPRPRFSAQGLPYPPMIRKVNPADYADPGARRHLATLADNRGRCLRPKLLLQKLSQISGVGLVGIGGEQQPTVRVQVDPQALAARGIGLEDVRAVLGEANVDLPKGQLNSPRRPSRSIPNDQLFRPATIRQPDRRLSQRFAVYVRDIGHVISAGENELITAGTTNSRRSSWRSSVSPGPTSSRP